MATTPSEILLLDATVLVDFLRGHHPAAEFLDAARTRAQLSCSAVTAAELIVGARTRSEQRAVEQFVGRFELEPITAEDCTRALGWLRKFHHSRGIGFHDCLIAAAASRLRAVVATLDEKHFRAIPGIRIERPY